MAVGEGQSVAAGGGVVKLPGLTPGGSEQPRRIGRSSWKALPTGLHVIAGVAVSVLRRTCFHAPEMGVLGRPARSSSLLISLAGRREIPRSFGSSAVPCAQSVVVAVDRVTGDLPESADLERVDLARGEQVEHEGPAYAEQSRRFLD